MFTDRDMLDLLCTTNREKRTSLVTAIPDNDLRPALLRVTDAYHGSYEHQRELWYQEHEKRMKLEKQLEDIRKKMPSSDHK